MVHSDRNAVTLIKRFARGQGISTSYAAKLASGSGDTVDRIERGMSLTGRRAEKITRYLSDHWPADLAWPADIPRPLPTPNHPREAA